MTSIGEGGEPTWDLNLLRVLDAVMRERNVTAAARRLHLSQSSVSHALNRLRRAFGDPLIVRHGNSMVPTAEGRRLAVEADEIMGRLRRHFPGPKFDPATSHRRFVLAVPDTLVARVCVPLLDVMRREAPSAGLELRRLDAGTAAGLADGSIDAAVSVAGRLTGELGRAPLLDVGWVPIVSRAHPLTGSRPVPAELVAWPHVVVPDAPVNALVDELLAAHGVARTVTAVVTSAALIPAVVAATDLIGFVPAGDRSLDRIEALAPAFDIPTIPNDLYWGSACEGDQGHTWFLGALRTLNPLSREPRVNSGARPLRLPGGMS